MFKNIVFCIAAIVISTEPGAQDVGIGVTSTNRAILEVYPDGLFGTGNGISISSTSIGFNRTGGVSPLYLGNGYASRLSFDPATSNGLEYVIYPYGTANSAVPVTGITAMKIGTPTGNKILTTATLANAVLDVARGTGFNGTAEFAGTNPGSHSHFNYGTEEDTYIRGGKTTSKVIINDVSSGTTFNRVVLGIGTSRVGINYNNPTATFEIRQSGGTGIKMVGFYGSWEWRVSGSPGRLYALYNGAIKTYISPIDGTLHPVSDERLKKEIETLPPILEKILQLNPVSYYMINDNPNRIQSIGFVAQDVVDLFPQLVNSRGAPSYNKLLSLNYSGFAVLAVKGIQEEQKLIEQLEQKTTEAELLVMEIEKTIENRKKQQ